MVTFFLANTAGKTSVYTRWRDQEISNALPLITTNF
jgi:hypothetical protein